jgi:hypothetical protein
MPSLQPCFLEYVRDDARILGSWAAVVASREPLFETGKQIQRLGDERWSAAVA